MANNHFLQEEDNSQTVIFFLLEHSIHFWSQDKPPVGNRPETWSNGAQETRAIDWSGGLVQGGKKLIDCTYYHSTSFLKIMYTKQFGCTDSFYFFYPKPLSVSKAWPNMYGY